jgi:hypothetical protein
MMNSSTNDYPRKRRSNAVPTAAAASVSQYTSRMVVDGQKQQQQHGVAEGVDQLL